MKYDFQKNVDRFGTDCYKWDCLPSELPMWVADMDYEVALPIQEALKKRIDKPVFGYTMPPKRFFPSYVDFMKRYGLESKEEEYVYSNGVIPTLSCCIRTFSKPKDKVILLTPVYQVFYHIIEDNGREVLGVELSKKEDGTYDIPFDRLEEAFAQKDASLFILCSPHNPVGRIWKKEELKRIGELAKRYDVLVLSDEVHGPLALPGKTYLPYAAASSICAKRSITALAPTKSFNVAGIQTSVAYIPNPELRKTFAFAINRDEGAEGTVFSYIVSIAALDESLDWLDQCRDAIGANVEEAKRILKGTKLKITPIEATYLLWVDVSAYDEDDAAFCEDLRKKTGLWITPGSTYGKGGKGYVRINLATSLSRVKDGMGRLLSYLKSLD